MACVTIIKKRREFEGVYGQGERFSGSGFVVIRLATGADITRFGITITRKLGKAVVRNRLRRRIKAVLASVAGRIRPGFDVVIIPWAHMGRAPFADVLRGIPAVLTQARILERECSAQ